MCFFPLFLFFLCFLSVRWKFCECTEAKVNINEARHVCAYAYIIVCMDLTCHSLPLTLTEVWIILVPCYICYANANEIRETKNIQFQTEFGMCKWINFQEMRQKSEKKKKMRDEWGWPNKQKKKVSFVFLSHCTIHCAFCGGHKVRI